MSVLGLAVKGAERGWLPDKLIRRGIRSLLQQRLDEEKAGGCELQYERFQSLIDELRQSPIALVPEKANEQHYEWPAEFFHLSLGEHRKYSCCYWPEGTQSLDEAEAQALKLTCERAQLADGQRILELGCGWGSLSLWMARQYPNSRITAVSNSSSQREYIESQARGAGLANLHVVTADMNDFRTDDKFDRVVSLEMFEHMRNYEELLRRIRTWLTDDGKLLVHIFCHRELAYPFEDEGDHNWMGRLFFSGGLMPSDRLLTHFQRDMALSRQWRWDGTHYERTSNAWLAKMDENRERIQQLLQEQMSSAEAKLWIQRWRIFYMSCAELFGLAGGQQWWVSHYLFEPQPARKSDLNSNSIQQAPQFA